MNLLNEPSKARVLKVELSVWQPQDLKLSPLCSLSLSLNHTSTQMTLLDEKSATCILFMDR